HGRDADGAPLWVARSAPGGASTVSGIQLGKVRPGFPGVSIPFDGREVFLSSYEVLMQEGLWLPARDGLVPAGAVVCGREGNGDVLFVARAAHAGGIHPGKVRFALGGAYISFGGDEFRVNSYEVLVSQPGLR